MTKSPPTRPIPRVPSVPLKVGYHQTLSEVLAALGWSHMTIVPGDLFYANPGASTVGLAAVCDAVPERDEPPLVWDAGLGRHRYARSAGDRGDPEPEKGETP